MANPLTIGALLAAILVFVTCQNALLCYKCNERITGTDVCKNATQEDCGFVFPQQESVCLKTVQRFSSGQPSWVFAQCQIQQAFTQEQIDKCQVSLTQGTNNASDTLETCTCTSDLCNPAPRPPSSPFSPLTTTLLTLCSVRFMLIK